MCGAYAALRGRQGCFGKVDDLGVSDRLPPHWQDMSRASERQERLTTQLRNECGSHHVLAQRDFRCAATCEACDSALFERDRHEWAVANLTWMARPQADGLLPWVEAMGSWADVLPVIEEHARGVH